MRFSVEIGALFSYHFLERMVIVMDKEHNADIVKLQEKIMLERLLNECRKFYKDSENQKAFET